MKNFLTTLALSLATAFISFAGPLQKEQIPAGAKWLLHLDVENGLKTQLGTFLGGEIGKQLLTPIANLRDYFDVRLDWRKFQSFTAYGMGFEERADAAGVLIVKSSQDLPAMLDQVIAKFEEAAGPGHGALRKKKEGGATVYVLKKEVFGAAGKGGVFVLSKSIAKLTEALDVLEGNASHLGAAKTFAAFPQPSASFFFIGLADGFNNASNLPPQARVLKNSTGGQFAVGEKAGQVFLNLALSVKDDESTAQIQQVFQGLLALATLNQDKNKELARLAQSIKVSTNSTLVNVSLELPATNVIAQVEGELKKRGR